MNRIGPKFELKPPDTLGPELVVLTDLEILELPERLAVNIGGGDVFVAFEAKLDRGGPRFDLRRVERSSLVGPANRGRNVAVCQSPPGPSAKAATS